MASIQVWFGGVVVFCLLALPIVAFSHGASPASCKEMVPGHIRAHPLDPEHSYVTVQTSASSYLPGQLITVMVRSSRDFMGFLLQARSISVKRRRYGRGAGIRSRRLGPLMAGGSWILSPPGTHILHCLSEGDAVTHSDKQPKRNLSFVWRAPAVSMGDVQFIITVVQSYFIYWAGVESAVVHDGSRSVWNSDEITAVDGRSTVSTDQEERVTAPPGVNNSSKTETNGTRTLKPTNGGSQTLDFLKTQAEFNQTALGSDNSVTLTNHTGVSKETTHDPDVPPKSSIPLTSSIDSGDDRKMDPTTSPISLSNPPLPVFPQKGKGTKRDDPKIKSQEPKLKNKSETLTPETTTAAPLISQTFHNSNTSSDSQIGSIQEEISSNFVTRRMLENILSWSQTSAGKAETGLSFQTSSSKPNRPFQTETSWITFLSKPQTTTSKSAFPSKSSSLGPKSIKPTISPLNATLPSGSPPSPSLNSLHQTSSETQSRTSAVNTKTGLLSQTSSTEPNLPFQTQTSHISLVLETFTLETQTLPESILPSRSPTLKSFKVTPVTQTNPLPGTRPSGPKSTLNQTSSPRTTTSLTSPSQRQSGVSFHQVQSETVPTQPGLLWTDQSQSEVPEETLRTSPQPQSQTLLQTGQTLSPRPVKPQFFTLEKDLKSEAKKGTVSPVFVFTPSNTPLPSVVTLSPLGSSSSFHSLDGSSGLRPSDTSPLHPSVRSTIHSSSSSSSENQPRTIPVSTSPHLPSAQRSSTTNQPSLLTSSIVPPSNSSFASVPVSTPSFSNSSKCFTSSNFSSSSTSTASQSFFSSSSPPTPSSFASSPTLPPPSVSSTQTSSSSPFTSITLTHPGPSSPPYYFLQTLFMTSVSSKKTTASRRLVIHTHLTSSNPEPNLGSVVHPNPKPFPNHKFNRGQETKPNVPNTDTKPKWPSNPSKTPDREGKYPDINPRHSSWELGMLLGCSAGLGMVLVVGVRYVYRQACGRRTEVTLNDREREYGRGLIQVQECGDLVRVRKIRENSFVLLTEYDVLAPPGN